MYNCNFGLNIDEFYKNVEKEFGKSRSDVYDYAADFRKWASTQKHFPEVPSLNACTYFLVTCKFSIEKAKSRIDMYYTIRNLMPEIFDSHPLSPKFVQYSRLFYCVALPRVTEKNERIIYLRQNPEMNPDDFIHENLMIQYIHLMEILIQKDTSNNLHAILDLAGIKPSQFPKFSLVIVQKFILYVEKVTSSRVASLSLVNLYPLAETLANTILVPFLPQKLKNRFHTDTGTASLLERFGEKLMPSDIGGQGPSLEETQGFLMKEYETMKDRFDKIQHMTCNESLRPEKLKSDDILGYYGSFRQLRVD